MNSPKLPPKNGFTHDDTKIIVKIVEGSAQNLAIAEATGEKNEQIKRFVFPRSALYVFENTYGKDIPTT